jgi:hypothetical protein
MLNAYAAYLQALSQPARRDLHRETRTAARTARTNAQASLDRMRAEPGTPIHLLELAQALFANGNRLARTSMTLEALLDDHTNLPESTEVSAFIEQAQLALHQVADALRHQRALQPLPELRVLQRSLASLLSMSEERAIAEQLNRLSDRLVDNINTLAYIVERSLQTKSTAAAAS